MSRKTIDDADLPPEVPSAEEYFLSPKTDMFSSGCTMLNCALGGGWAKKRVLNIVGDRSTGKTLLAIEACANYALKFTKDLIHYCEVESAFDKPYAERLGLPLKRMTFNDDTGAEKNIRTVEALYKDLEKFSETCTKKKVGGLYIVDSLDALSDEAEMGREIDDKTFGASKAKKMSELFRKINQVISKAGVTLVIISQVRENIGVTFGKSTIRSGGKALDFYASQVIELATLGRIRKTINRVEKPIGVKIRCRCEKNKVALPFREAAFEILFGYGVDDIAANLNYMQLVGEIDLEGYGPIEILLKKLPKMPDDLYRQLAIDSAREVKALWREIEKKFLPTRRKYE